MGYMSGWLENKNKLSFMQNYKKLKKSQQQCYYCKQCQQQYQQYNAKQISQIQYTTPYYWVLSLIVHSTEFKLPNTRANFVVENGKNMISEIKSNVTTLQQSYLYMLNKHVQHAMNNFQMLQYIQRNIQIITLLLKFQNILQIYVNFILYYYRSEQGVLAQVTSLSLQNTITMNFTKIIKIAPFILIKHNYRSL
eukprot:TRINITY_DN18253_c0_g1_i3.p2 TRINITY_DN18253_c0_g1~~TRINITY_DN18253_c0_g1_i3.p2  ORF type:complete len:194 (+),score=-18.67 TRINITY_DN18253_c0_g1_i3:130-711(+)